MFGKFGIDFGPETHEGFSDREWKLACEFFDLMLQLPLPEDEDEWDSFFDWALSEVFFEGSQNMLRKLERITAQNFPVEMGEDA